MDDLKEMLRQVIGEMPPDRRAKMEQFIQLVADRDPCALRVIRRIESGALAPTEAFTALDACLQARH